MSKRKALPADLSRPRPGVTPTDDPQGWAEWQREIEDYLGYRVCGHKNRSGTPCTLEPAAGRTRCKHAGGGSLRGPENGSWKHGRSSQVAAILPTVMREKYEALINDDKLLALGSDIALADMRQMELLEQIVQGSNPMRALENVRSAVADLRVAMAEGDNGRVAELLDRMSHDADSASGGNALWEDWMDLGEHKRKLMSEEGKRMERMGHYMTAEQVRAYNAMVIAAVQRAAQQHVPDQFRRPFLTQLLVEIAMYSGLQPGAPARQGSGLPSPADPNDLDARRNR